MRRILYGLVLLLAFNSLFAQSVEDIKDLIVKQQWDKAKTAVDGYLSKEKNAVKWEGWWFKGVIYNEIAKSEQFKSLSPDARMEALNAFKKYYEIDTKMIQATLEQHVRLFDIYNGYFDQAVADFGASKFEGAYTNFKNAYTTEEYVASKGFEYNGFKFPEFDTTLIQNIALSAYRANKHDEAAVYYKKIADQKIAGKDNIDVYQLLIEYYTTKNDRVNREKYLVLARELYPQEDRWYQLELEEADEKDKKALFAKYEELLPKYPDKYILAYNYGVELFNYAYTGDTKPADYKETQVKLENALKYAIAANKSYPEANILMSRHCYNMIYDIQEEIKTVKGNTPADQKKKAELNTQMKAMADQLIPYGLTAYDIYNTKATLKPSEKGNFKIVTDLLSSAYFIKGDKAKADEYSKKLESIQ